MNKKTLKDVEIKGKKVLVRVDFNVPLDKSGNITDDTRIKATLPTIKYILEHNAKLILMSHLGRPKGVVVEGMSLKPVAKRLSELLGKDVKMLEDCIGEKVANETSVLKEGEVVLLENLRFHPEEEKNDPSFAKALAVAGEIYVNDAFGSSHRAHASVEGITKFLPSVSGFLVQKEIEFLSKVMVNPPKPFALILGGAKVSDKIGVIINLMKKVDCILIGGAMAYTFLKAKGVKIGSSRLEDDKVELAGDILNGAEEKKIKIYLPVDHIASEKLDGSQPTKELDQEIPDGFMGLDIGPKTVNEFNNALKDVKTIVWNGPLGLFEVPQFSEGTKKVAEFVSGLDATVIIGGGDTASAVKSFGLEAKMSHVSTGGGASLEYLEGKTLPGIAALEEK